MAAAARLTPRLTGRGFSPFTFPVGPQLICPTKLRVREGERLSCEVRGNPPPLVTWYRNGKAVVLPAHSSREHAGKYTALARGPLELKTFTVEVEILGNHGETGASLHSFAVEESFGSSFFLFRKRKQLQQTFPAACGARARGKLDVKCSLRTQTLFTSIWKNGHRFTLRHPH